MVFELGLEWFDLPWVAGIELFIGRLQQNAATSDKRATESEGITAGRITTEQDKLLEWLCETPKTSEEVAVEEDDELLSMFGLRRPKMEEVSDD